MRINVYKINKVKPVNAEQEAEFCDILGLPSLKLGYGEFVGRLDGWITKAELKKAPKVSARFFDRTFNVWREGFLLLNYDTKTFAECTLNSSQL